MLFLAAAALSSSHTSRRPSLSHCIPPNPHRVAASAASPPPPRRRLRRVAASAASPPTPRRRVADAQVLVVDTSQGDAIWLVWFFARVLSEHRHLSAELDAVRMPRSSAPLERPAA